MNKNCFYLLQWLVLSFFLAACTEVGVKDGRISAEDKHWLDLFVGNYSGDLRLYTMDQNINEDWQKGASASLRVDPNGRVALEFSKDIVGENCHSSAADLRKLYISDDKGEAFTAEFSFDRGSCASQIYATEIHIAARRLADGNIQMQTFLLKEYSNRLSRRGVDRPLDIAGFFTKRG